METAVLNELRLHDSSCLMQDCKQTQHTHTHTYVYTGKSTQKKHVTKMRKTA